MSGASERRQSETLDGTLQSNLVVLKTAMAFCYRLTWRFPQGKKTAVKLVVPFKSRRVFGGHFAYTTLAADREERLIAKAVNFFRGCQRQKRHYFSL